MTDRKMAEETTFRSPLVGLLRSLLRIHDHMDARDLLIKTCFRTALLTVVENDSRITYHDHNHLLGDHDDHILRDDHILLLCVHNRLVEQELQRS